VFTHYLSIDSNALDGMWNGHMSASYAIDGHNWILPVAFGLFDSETKENWIWFMEQLGSAFGPIPNLIICTDALKGLEIAVEKVFPWAEQSECFRHLMENMKKNFTGTEYAKYMWLAAKAYTPEKHHYLLNKVLQNTLGLQQWLQKHHKLKWIRSKFSEHVKCDYINSNLAESWYSWVKELKDLRDVMADAIKEKMVVLFEKRRKI
jgi:transposase-like protein